MTGPEKGFLLLTSQLGDPERRPLTVAQFRKLANLVAGKEHPGENRELEEKDLLSLGYDAATAQRILSLLGEKNRLREYLHRADEQGCTPVTRLSDHYPLILRKRLGLDSPGCLWAKGDLTLLEYPGVSLVGSRELKRENLVFAEAAGIAAVEQGFVLISGNARGADRIAQESCLANGGSVISVVADSLQEQPERENVLYLSLDAFDSPFSTQRALRRNHVIHCLGYLTLVAQCTLGKGGTWNGTVQNLRSGWNNVCCYADGSQAAEELSRRGARCIFLSELNDLRKLGENPLNFFDQ